MWHTAVTEASQAASDGTSGQVKQAARSVGANSKHRVVEVFMSLREEKSIDYKKQ